MKGEREREREQEGRKGEGEGRGRKQGPNMHPEEVLTDRRQVVV